MVKDPTYFSVVFHLPDVFKILDILTKKISTKRFNFFLKTVRNELFITLFDQTSLLLV